MGDIYRKAQNVSVWLGQVEAGDKDVFDHLRVMSSIKGVKDILKSAVDPTKDIVEKFHHLLARSWWDHLWVVQEVALGQHVVFQIGQEILEFDALLAARQNCEACLRESLNGFMGGGYSSNGYHFVEAFKCLNVLNQVRELCKHSKAEHDATWIRSMLMEWTSTVNGLRNQKATDDRDRLYALYGLLPMGLT